MSTHKIDPRLADEVARQRGIAIEDNARWGRMFLAGSFASIACGVGVWFLLDPEDRGWGSACAVVVSAWLTGISLQSLFGSNRSAPKCPRCGTAWDDEEHVWPTWKHCPGCGLVMSEGADGQEPSQ